jgi:hypothetical protein
MVSSDVPPDSSVFCPSITLGDRLVSPYLFCPSLCGSLSSP